MQLRKTYWLRMSLSLCLIFFVTTAVQGIAQEKHPITTITVAKVKLDKTMEFERLLKQEWIPAMKKSGIPWVSGWQAADLGPAGTYVFAGEIPNLAVYDAPHPLIKVLGEAKFAALVGELRNCLNSLERHAVDMDMSLSTLPADSPAVAVYVQANVLPGQGPAFRKFLAEEVVPAVKKSAMKGFLVQWERFGSGPGVHLVVFAENYAALDKGHPFIQAHGQEKGMAMINKSSSLMSVQSVYPIRLMPELSYGNEQ